MNLLITKNDLIENCALSENSADNKVNVAIQQAHNKLQAVLCRDFYEELRTQFLSDSLTVYNASLMSYVKMYLVWEAYSSFVVVGAFDQTKAGFRQHTDENSQVLNSGELNMLKKNAEEQALFWKGELVNYLYDNIDNYATFKGSNCYCKKTTYNFKISGAGSKKKWHY